MTDHYLGVDLGGTGTRIVLTTGAGVVLADRSEPTATDAARAAPALVEALTAVAGPLGATVAGIGIGASGPVDAGGVIRNPATLPAYTGLDLTQILRAVFGVPIVMENDAVTAVYGEVALGAGRGAGSVLMVTLGTGVGVAMLTGGRPLRTAAGVHPEAGHLYLPGDAPCYCGRSSCWEQQASRSALQQTVTDQLGVGLDDAYARASTGDAAATAVFSAYGHAVGRGLADLLTLLAPERVVLGGGGARFLTGYRSALLETLDEITGCYPPVPVVPAELGDIAGAVGAALWVASS